MADIPIYGTLHNVTGEPISTADQSKDENLGKTQQELNELFNQGKNAAGESLSGDYSAGDAIKEIGTDKIINVDFGDDQDALIDAIFGSEEESSSTEVLDSNLATDNYAPTGVYDYPTSDKTSTAYKTAAGYGTMYVGFDTYDSKPAVRAAVVGNSVDPSKSLFTAGTSIGAVYAITSDGSTQKRQQGKLEWKAGNAFFATFDDCTEIMSAVVEIQTSSGSTILYNWLRTNAGNQKISFKLLS